MSEYLHLLMSSSLLTGLLGMASLGFISLAFKRGMLLYRVLFLISLSGFLYGLCETAVLYLGITENYSLAMEFSRSQQLVLSAFFVLLPLVLIALGTENQGLQNIHRFLLFFGTASALIITLFAFLVPDVFTSLTFSSGLQFLPLVDLGRGREGPLYQARNGLLAVYMAFFLVRLLAGRLRGSIPPEGRGLLLGTVPAILLGFTEIWEDFFGDTIPGLRDALPSPVLWGLAFFSAVNLLLSRPSPQGDAVLGLTDQLSGIDLSGQRRPGTKALLLVDMENSRFLGRWKSETRLALALNRIKGCLRNSDRLGVTEGGEAVVVLEQLGHPADAAMAAIKILEASGPTPRPKRVGIALIPRDGTDIASLLAKGREALEKARQGSMPYSFLSDAHNSEAQHRIVLMEALRTSQSDPEQYNYHFQPIFDHQGQIFAAEALIRWKNAEGLSPSPEIFIPLAEASGVLGKISPQLLELGLRSFLSIRNKTGKAMVLSFNLTGRQLRDPALRESLKFSAEKYNLSFRDIRLEVPESALSENLQESRQMLKLYAADGFRLALDNFGLGFSTVLPSENYFDTFILDRSLVHRLGWQRKEEVLLRALVQLTADLGIQLAAKGVETFQQQELLKTLGIQIFQGFFYSPGLTPQEFVDFAGRSRPPRPLAGAGEPLKPGML